MAYRGQHSQREGTKSERKPKNLKRDKSKRNVSTEQSAKADTAPPVKKGSSIDAKL